MNMNRNPGEPSPHNAKNKPLGRFDKHPVILDLTGSKGPTVIVDLSDSVVSRTRRPNQPPVDYPLVATIDLVDEPMEAPEPAPLVIIDLADDEMEEQESAPAPKPEPAPTPPPAPAGLVVTVVPTTPAAPKNAPAMMMTPPAAPAAVAEPAMLMTPPAAPAAMAEPTTPGTIAAPAEPTTSDDLEELAEPTTPAAAGDAVDDAPKEPERSSRRMAGIDGEDIPMSYECPVCFEYVTGRQAASTVCGHVFCWECILRVIRTNHMCPLCNARLASSRSVRRLYL